MRIVFDSSIWVSALEYGGVPRTAIEFAVSHDEVLFCRQIENEIVETLTQKFAKSAVKTQQRIKLLAEDATWVVVPGLLFGVCRDPNDDFILECAILGEAEAIVTGDKDLLSLGHCQDIRILTPRQYLDQR